MSYPLRIALVCTSLNQLGGKNNHLKNIYRHLDSAKFKVLIISSSAVEKELKEFMLAEGVKSGDLILLSQAKKRLILPFIWELRNIYLLKKIDIVHTFQIQSDILAGLAARLAGVKHIFSHFESKIIEDNIGPLKKIAYKIGNAFMKKRFKQTVAVSEGLKNELISGNFRPPERVSVIPLGFRCPQEYENYKFSFENLLRERPLIGSISRFSREKGLERFIQAIPLVLKAAPQARFALMGKGEEEAELMSLRKKLKLEEALIFWEWSRNIYPQLEKIDIFVMPSLREGCPTALLEALALSRPVIASDIEGIREIVEDNRHGLLVDTANTGLFADKIIAMIKDPQGAIRLGQNGRARVFAQFTFEAEMKQFEELYLNNYEDKTK